MLTAGCRFAHKEFKQLSRDLRRIGGERLNGGLQSDRASRYANLMTFYHMDPNNVHVTGVQNVKRGRRSYLVRISGIIKSRRLR